MINGLGCKNCMVYPLPAANTAPWWHSTPSLPPEVCTWKSVRSRPASACPQLPNSHACISLLPSLQHRHSLRHFAYRVAVERHKLVTRIHYWPTSTFTLPRLRRHVHAEMYFCLQHRSAITEHKRHDLRSTIFSGRKNCCSNNNLPLVSRPEGIVNCLRIAQALLPL